MISLLYTSADVNCLLARFCSEPSRYKEGTLPQLLEFILHLSVERGHVIDVNLISRLLKPDIITPRVSSALVAYISGTKIEDLQGINCFETTVPEQMAVVYSLIPKLKTIRDVALNRLNEEIQAGSTLLLTERVSALLEVYSVAIADSTNFDWATCANGTIKTKLQIAFNVTQKELLQTAPNTHQVNVLQRAISLFPSLNRKDFLKRIATNRMRSALTDSTVALVDALVEKSDDAYISEMKGWFLMVFDHLTRRFAEDAVLSDKVIAIAMALGLSIPVIIYYFY